jgi:hypothetical protein
MENEDFEYRVQQASGALFPRSEPLDRVSATLSSQTSALRLATRLELSGPGLRAFGEGPGLALARDSAESQRMV